MNGTTGRDRALGHRGGSISINIDICKFTASLENSLSYPVYATAHIYDFKIGTIGKCIILNLTDTIRQSDYGQTVKTFKRALSYCIHAL